MFWNRCYGDRTMASTSLLLTLISQNELTIMRLKQANGRSVATQVEILQRQIDNWRDEIERRNSLERMRRGPDK